MTAHVVDQTGTLTQDEMAALEQTLTAFEARKGSQLAVLIVPSSAPEAIEPFALRVAEQWKLGRKKVDDGALLVVAKDDRTLRIEVGYGLEGALTDLTSKRIIDETIVPRFKQQDFYGGITAGIAQVIRVIDGEPLPAPLKKSDKGFFSNSNDHWYSADAVLVAKILLYVSTVVVGGLLHAKLGRVRGALAAGAITAIIVWAVPFESGLDSGFRLGIALFLGAIMLVSGLLITEGPLRSGYYSGGPDIDTGGSGGGGFSGGGGLSDGGRFSSGGGFSGGGGGFGGGGASGRW